MQSYGFRGKEIRLMKKIIFLFIALGICLIFMPYAQADLNEGLVAYYPFNGNANDASGNGNHGILYGAVLTQDRFGNPNRAYDFDGVDDSIEVPDHPDFHFTNQMTVAAWVRPYHLIHHNILNKSYALDSYSLSVLNGKFKFTVNFPNGQWGYGEWVEAPAFLDQWTHVAGVYNGQKLLLFVNGILAASKLVTGTLQDSNRPIVIGNHPPWEAYEGTIDDIRMYNRPLSKEEVFQLYNAEEIKIEAESFDAQQGVNTGISSNGVNYVGWIENNDCIMFEDVDFGSDTHQFIASVASNGNGGDIEIRLGSKYGTQIGSCSVPNTSGWYNWTTVNCNINAVSGITQRLYLVFKGSGYGLFNVDWISYVYSPSDDTPPPPPPNGSDAQTKIEAESFDAQQGTNTGASSDGGAYVGWIENNDYIMFKDVDFGSNTHLFIARVASNTNGGDITLRLDSKNGTQIGSCTVPGTNGWENWITETCDINPVSGVKDLYLVFIGTGYGLFNLDWILFATSSPDDSNGIIDAHSRIEAESFNSQQGVNKGVGSGGVTYVGWIENNDHIMFEKVDFGSNTNQFKARVASNSSGGDINIHLGSKTGTQIGSCSVPGTSGWENWTTVTCNINDVSGITEKLYLVFKGSGYGLFNIDWFRFDSK
jgi:hypothetical protein